MAFLQELAEVLARSQVFAIVRHPKDEERFILTASKELIIPATGKTIVLDDLWETSVVSTGFFNGKESLKESVLLSDILINTDRVEAAKQELTREENNNEHAYDE